MTAAERHCLRSTISSAHEAVKILPEIRQPCPKTGELSDLEGQGEMRGRLCAHGRDGTTRAH